MLLTPFASSSIVCSLFIEVKYAEEDVTCTYALVLLFYWVFIEVKYAGKAGCATQFEASLAESGEGDEIVCAPRVVGMDRETGGCRCCIIVIVVMFMD